MKKILIITLAFMAFLSYAESEYEFEPVSNKAEYYSGKFNKGKDMQDLLLWAEKFVKWSEQNDFRKSTLTAIFTPYFHDQLDEQDFVWLNIIPNSTEQYSSLGYWIKNGGKLFATLPATNSRVIDVIQWPVSVPEGEFSDLGIVRFSRCKLEEGVNLRQAFDAYKRFAIKARSTGDNMGRKILFSPTGAGDQDYDYVYLLHANSWDDFGMGYDNYGENLVNTPEAQALNSIANCSNARTYSTNTVKRPGGF